MRFNTNTEDKAEGFAFTDGTSADDVLMRIGSDFYKVDFKESEHEVQAYDWNVYKVTILIEPA